MPKITDIVQQKKNKNRYSIFVDHSFFCGTSDYIVAKFKLKIDMDIDVALLKTTAVEDSLEKAKAYVVNYCLAKSRHAVIQKLKQKEYDDEVINLVLDFLDRYNLVDDSQYAKAYSHDAILLKKQGKQLIKYKLKQKGINNDDIEQALSHVTYEDEYNAAKKLINSVYDKYKRKAKNDRDLKYKLSSYLYSRGYPHEIISELINNIQD